MAGMLLASASACSSDGSSGRAEPTASLGMKITLPSGLVINHVNYVLSGGPQTYSGTIDVTSTPVIQLGLSNIAPGSNYVLSETATTQDGGAVCSGQSAPFSVAAGATASVTVALACTAPADSGAMVGTTVASACPTVASAIASPSELIVGGVTQLTASATAPVPTALTYQWSAPAGTFSAPTSATTNFTCPSAAGPVTITLTTSDGPIPAGGSCPVSDTTTTLTVTCDAVLADAGADTSTIADSSTADAADASTVDTGTDAAPSLVPCTTPGQTGCVACSGNAGGTCTADEALLVQKDIAAGNAATTPCYTCALNAGCIDDTTFGDHGFECGDLSGTFGSTGIASSTLCMNTLQCILGTGCASSAAAGCYCGSSVGPSCVSAASPNGACLNQEVQGLGFTSNQDVLKNYTNTTTPSGVANQFAQCALSNSCAACLK
jgi:hypothetical protein